ncbi:MAG: hypothetical protein R3254_08375 [Thiomicrorhabdus sp.]|nr:hypothetical protein [Thiomicrorhabdus sp.]
MKQTKMDEGKLKELLSIDQEHSSKEERALMILQGVNWLTLIQEVFILFIHKVPLALFSMVKTLSNSKDMK